MSTALVAYIPALHQGYVNLFRQHPGDVYVLGPRFLSEVPRLDRDIRALEPILAWEFVSDLGLGGDVGLLESESDLEHLRAYAVIKLPDEDVSRQFADRWLADWPVQFVPAFLRWDKQISTTEFEVTPGRTISQTELDRQIIGQAKAEAAKSPDWWRQVGAALVRDGTVLLAGHNRPLVAPEYTFGAFGDPRSNFDAGQHIELSKAIHAESALIAAAARQGIVLAGASMYVTTFPCPVCAKLIAAAGITRVCYAEGYSLLDAEDVLSAAGIELVLVQ